MTRAPSHSIAGNGRKALVALLVIGVHAWLLSLRLPSDPRSPLVHEPADRVTVQLLAPSAPMSAAQPRTPARSGPASAARRPSTRPAPPGTASTVRPMPDSQPEPGAAMPSVPAAPTQARGPGPIAPDLRSLQVPPSLAERAQARLGPSTPADALQRGIESSARPDCKEAYAGLVLLAIPALLRDAFREDGCKW